MGLYKMFRRYFRELPKIKDFFDRLAEHNIIVQPLSDGNQRILMERKSFSKYLFYALFFTKMFFIWTTYIFTIPL